MMDGMIMIGIEISMTEAEFEELVDSLDSLDQRSHHYIVGRTWAELDWKGSLIRNSPKYSYVKDILVKINMALDDDLKMGYEYDMWAELAGDHDQD